MVFLGCGGRIVCLFIRGFVCALEGTCSVKAPALFFENLRELGRKKGETPLVSGGHVGVAGHGGLGRAHVYLQGLLQSSTHLRRAPANMASWWASAPHPLALTPEEACS